MTTTKVVDLLRDGRGVYGIGVPGDVDHRELAIVCGHESAIAWKPPALILRPDMLAVPKYHKAALQKITGGFRHGMFSRCIEEHLRQVIHYQMLYTAGLP